MANWIPGQGFYYVQSTGPIDHEQNKKRMDLLEQRLQTAKLRISMEKEKSA